MRRIASVAFVTSLLLVPVAGLAAPAPAQRPALQRQIQPYFPDRLNWERKRPEEVGMNAAKLDEAVRLAISTENPSTKNMANYLATTFGANEPLDTPIGPIKDRGAANGLVMRNGYIVAEWGDTNRVDMTFSVTKTFVTTIVGLAVQRGLIKDTNDFARDYMPSGVDLFESEHNRKIRWEHLLRQTSDWQGTLWGKPDWADRPEGATAADWPNRRLSEPGTRYKYNDVRVNLLALAALHVWRRPLPEIARTEIMDPIGASSTWRWYGYENSWVDIDGQKVQSVAAGGHWGGGTSDQRLRHGPLRLSLPAQRQVEGPRDRLDLMDRQGAHAGPGERRLRLCELVPQHRQAHAAGGARIRRSSSRATVRT